MSPSQRSVSVGNIADYSVTEPLCETNLTHVSCDHLDKKLPRVPPPPPPRVSSLQRAPSQALMHYTTVPQSLVTRSLATRHQPTRSSLRHSRMLVMIREGRVPRKYLPGVLSRSKYGLLVSVSQLVLGLIMLGLAVWRMMIQEQMTLVWDWPLYSGVACLWSGWVGVWLICCCRYYYPPYSQQPGSCVFPINSFSIIFSLLICLVSSVFCLVSTISHLLHLLTLMSASCDPPLKTPVSWPQHSCLCLSQSRLWRHGELVYPGTDCDHLLSIQPPLLIILILLNIISMFCSLIFMLLLACSKHNLTFRNWRNIKNYEVTRLGGELR